ncbi:hypothetical protein DH2020_046217 [Rehmannia glutinosa]|uniref:FAF domain-containing protein n=1 Tax=Rehmannia glutinosa TaxID=99300 RepID=A0ABR0UCN3_REHGL
MSSNSSVCKGLQSCLDPLILEHRVLTHSSFLPSSRKQSESYYAENQKKESCDIGENCEPNKNGEKSWNFLQAITNISYNSEQVYVHPLVKGSTFSMSPRSLEMCTESLGSENGSNFYSSFDEISYLVLEKQSCARKTKEKCEKIKHNNGFPPPLTSISGNNGVKMQRNYEGGRLVIKAVVDSSSCGTYFKAERENGRLRLSLQKENDENIGEAGRDCGETDVKRCLWAEKVKIKGGDWSSSSRCNGDGSKRLPSLPFCVAIS